MLQNLHQSRLGLFIVDIVFSEDSYEGIPVPAATAICKFSMANIESAFSGPFKKRINNAWRPVKVAGITPSPYSVRTSASNSLSLQMSGLLPITRAGH